MKRQLLTLSIVSLFIKSFGVLLNCDSLIMSFVPSSCSVESAVIAKGETIQFSNINKSSLLQLAFQQCHFVALASSIFIDYPQLTSLKVLNSKLRQLKIIDFKNANQLQTLSFFYNNISVLRNSTFRHCSNLMELEICDNLLTTIGMAAFSGLRKLQRLSICDSRIGRIPAAVFGDLVSLTEINLQNNSLTEIDPYLFRKNGNLDVVYLQDNQLLSLPDGFLNPTKLPSELNFMHNQLISASTMQSRTFQISEGTLKSLYITKKTEEFYANDNVIETISCPNGPLQVIFINLLNNSLSSFPSCISQMSKLMTLTMSQNKLKTINQSDFANLTQLKYLYLIKNPILQLTPKIFAQARNIKQLEINSLKSYKNLRTLFPDLWQIKLFTRKWSCNRITQVANVLNSQAILIFFDLFKNSLCQQSQFEFWNNTSDKSF